MSWDGFLRDANGEFPNCQRCGKRLNADSGHPAEVHLGSYTGLCYACEGAGPYVVRSYKDGAKIISYPPTCPSYRRNRLEWVAYDDCGECNGTGRHRQTRSDAQGGGYYTSCKSCGERFRNHPLRKEVQGKIEEAYTEFWDKWCRYPATEENKLKYSKQIEDERQVLDKFINGLIEEEESQLLC